MFAERHLTLALVLLLTLSAIVWPAYAANAATPSYQARGKLNVLYGDGPERFGAMTHYLYMDDGTRIRLLFASPPSLAYFGKQVVVTGPPPSRTILESGYAETVMHVESISLLATAGAQANAGLALEKVSGTRKMIILLLRYLGEISSLSRDPQFYVNLINPAVGNTVNSFYNAASWGAFGVQADVTPSWMILPHDKDYYAPCGWYGVCAYVEALAEDGIALGLANGVNFADYDMISFVLSNDLDCCAWGGDWEDTINGVHKTWGATWMPPWSQEAGTYSHEVGHSIGLPHSGWVYESYDSPWDVMSGGNRYNRTRCGMYTSANSGGTEYLLCMTPADTIAAFKDMLGWIDSNHVLTVSPGGSAFASVDSLAAPPGGSYKMLKICIPGYSCVSGGWTSRYLTVEARTRYGYDKFLPGEGVILHIFQGDRPLVGGRCFFIRDNPPAYPIDATPGDYDSRLCVAGAALSNAQWLVGQSYSDPSTLGPGRQLTVARQTGSSPNPVSFDVTITGTSPTPTVLLSPTSGPPGLVVAASGSGFNSADTTCTISSSPTGLISNSACSVSGGAVSGSFTVAPVPSGPYTVTVTGTTGDAGSAPFEVSRAMPVSSVRTDIVSAAAGSVIYVLPDWQSGGGHTKPPGVQGAELSDFTALGFMFGASTNNQIMALDTNSTYFDPATGAPKISNSLLVAFAGPGVNGVVDYYEDAGASPVYFQWAANGDYAWYDRQGGLVASMPHSAGQAGTTDKFLIEYFKDANNNKVFIIYGFAWKGTYAGGVFFKTYILPNITSFTHGWYVFQWNDTNGNDLPDPYEVTTTPVNYGD